MFVRELLETVLDIVRDRLLLFVLESCVCVRDVCACVKDCVGDC